MNNEHSRGIDIIVNDKKTNELLKGNIEELKKFQEIIKIIK